MTAKQNEGKTLVFTEVMEQVMLAEARLAAWALQGVWGYRKRKDQAEKSTKRHTEKNSPDERQTRSGSTSGARGGETVLPALEAATLRVIAVAPAAN